MPGRMDEVQTALKRSSEPLVRASLLALLNPADARPGVAPRELLVNISRDWADDASAWRLAKRLIPEAEAYMVEVEQRAADRPGDLDLARLRGRARYAHLVAIALYRDLRIPGRRAHA